MFSETCKQEEAAQSVRWSPHRYVMHTSMHQRSTAGKSAIIPVIASVVFFLLTIGYVLYTAHEGITR